MQFGEFLVNKKLATEEEINKALDIQRLSKVPLGKLAVEAGFIKKVDNIKLLLKQIKTRKRYGDLAVENGLLTKEQVIELLQIQKVEAIPLGKVLVKNGTITRFQSIQALLEFIEVKNEK